MEIETRYNINDIVEFHPVEEDDFNSMSSDVLTGKIISVGTFYDKTHEIVTYGVEYISNTRHFITIYEQQIIGLK